MWRGKKSVIVTLLGAVVLVISLVGAGCASTGNGGEGLPDMSNSTGSDGKDLPGTPWGEGQPGMPNNVLARVADILGIDQQRLEDAFAQAQTEMGDATPGDSSPEAIIVRTAEILEIEQQDLQDAFAQAQSEMVNEAPWQRPSDGNHTPWGANGE
jgi:hypothetical protein